MLAPVVQVDAGESVHMITLAIPDLMSQEVFAQEMMLVQDQLQTMKMILERGRKASS